MLPSAFAKARLLRLACTISICGIGNAGAATAGTPAEQITVLPNPALSLDATGVLDTDTIARNGTASLGALLDQVPAFGSQGVNDAQSNGGFGEHFIDLRNLNFDRTLVLVDNNRFVLSGIQTDEAVDLNIIPEAFIDRVEILKDGTQPRYGADAVAGAVNVVLKDQQEGVHLDAYGGVTGRPDGGTADISLLGGHDFSHGNFIIGLDLYRRDPIRQSDRAWSADPIAAATKSASGEQIQYGSPASPDGHAIAPGIDELALGASRAVPYDPATDFYDPAAFHDLQGGLQRESVYFDGDAALSSNVSANAELLYTDRRATTLQPPQTLGLNGTDKNPEGFTIPGSDPFNPFGQTVTLERVVSEAGTQLTTTSGPVWRAMAGLDGIQGTWDWSLSLDHGQSLSRYVTGNEINLSRALQTAGNGACLAASGCVEADWFGPDSLSQAALDYIRYTARSQSAYFETVAQTKLSGPLFTLPAGQARLTLGLEARAEAGSTTIDPVTAAGDQASNDASATKGSYQTFEGYGALELPLLSNVFLARRLALTAEARGTATSRYGSFGTFRGVLEYVPAQGIALHAVSGLARRPPAISEAFGGITGNPQAVTDPCDKTSGLRSDPIVDLNCRRQGLGTNFTQASSVIDVESGGNSSLRPEQSENEMFGLTLQPPSVKWLTASADYYHYRIRDAIDSLADTDPDLIPDLCYQSPNLTSSLCSLIHRISGDGNAGQISSILALDENVGTIKEDGLEFELKAAAIATRVGALHLDWQTNWLLNYRIHMQGETGFTQYAGTFPGSDEVGSYARIRSNASAVLNTRPWSFGWTGRFISGAQLYGDQSTNPFGKAQGVLYHDINMSRKFGSLTAMLGIDNLTNKTPPTLVDGETNTNLSTYDVVGRYFWARVSVDF